MSRDFCLEESLKAYEVAPADESQIAECIRQSKLVLGERKKSKGDIAFFMEVQLRFMRKEILFSFLIEIGLMLLLQMLKVFGNGNTIMGALAGVAPFLVVPVMQSVARSSRCGMLELETASRWGIQKIIAARLFGTQVLAVGTICFMWLISCASMEKIILQWLFMALISFEATTICFLWFGKSSLKSGVVWTMAWISVVFGVLSRKELVLLVESVSSVALFMASLLMLGACIAAGWRYIKNVCVESEEKKWNLSWIE